MIHRFMVAAAAALLLAGPIPAAGQDDYDIEALDRQDKADLEAMERRDREEMEALGREQPDAADEIGDDFDIDLEDTTSNVSSAAAPAPALADGEETGPWTLAGSRDGLIRQEAEIETELSRIETLLRAASQGKLLSMTKRGLSGKSTSHYTIEDEAKVRRMLSEGATGANALWTQAQADAWWREIQQWHADGVAYFSRRKVLLTDRLQKVRAAMR